MTEAPKKKKKWIKAAVAEGKGKLHEKLGVAKDKKIPEAKLDAATHSKNPTTKNSSLKSKTLLATTKLFLTPRKRKPGSVSWKTRY